MALRILTLNVRGMRDPDKRRVIFNFLRDNKIDIAFLQETHSEPLNYRYWRAEWGGDLYLSHGTNASCGVAILFRRQLGVSVSSSHIDDAGRYILLSISYLHKTLLLCNVYAPADTVSSRVEFFKQLDRFLFQQTAQDVAPLVLGGDFNTHLSSLDKSTASPTHPFHPSECATTLMSVVTKHDLADLWRKLHHTARGYTRHQTTPAVFSRIDFFFVDDSLLCQISECSVRNASFSDHNALLFSLSLSSTPVDTRSPYWKFNTSLLHDNEYLARIRQFLNEFSRSDQVFSTPQTKWDFLLCALRGETISFSAFKQRNHRERERHLEEEISSLSKTLFQDPDVNLPVSEQNALLDRLTFCRNELQAAEESRAQAARVRARIRWAELGEKSTRYFFQMEKQRQRETVIDAIEVSNQLITDQGTILKEIGSFYSTLLSSRRQATSFDAASDIFLNNPQLPKLSDDQSRNLEVDISDAEFQKALFSMSPNKAPGLSGFPCEFFKTFWTELFPYYRACIGFSFQANELSCEQRRTCIRLIPKPVPPADRQKFQKARRPIALLNTDYKILSKAITNRLMPVIDDLITSEQTAYLKGRFICENIRTLSDLIELYRNLQREGYVVFYDFEKAFDSIEWDYIEACLRAMNFPNFFISLIRLLNSNVSACVIVNSKLTDFFPITRGCRQGDPISAYLFILSMQPFVSYYSLHQRATSLALASSKVDILLFADDTVTTHDSIASIRCSFRLFRRFQLTSGLCLNLDKTLILPLLPLHSPELDLLGCRVEHGAVKYLGAWLNCTTRAEEQLLNFDKRAENYDALLNRWKLRGLSLIGRNLIVKALCLSQLTYPFQFILPSERVLKAYISSTEQFIWHSRPKVKRSTTTASLPLGGLKIIDVRIYARSLQLAWVARFASNPTATGWRSYLSTLLKPLGGSLLLACNFDASSLPANLPEYYKQILAEWFSFPKRPGVPLTIDDIAMTVIWNNRDLLIGGKSFFFRTWVSAGIFYLGQIVKADGSFLSQIEFSVRFGLIGPADWLRYAQVKACIPAQWRLTLLRGASHLSHLDFCNPPEPRFFDSRKSSYLRLASQKSKVFYSVLSAATYQAPTAQATWLRDLGPLDLLSYFRLLSKLHLPPWYMSFQWKILHRLIPTRSYLCKRRLCLTDSCPFCDDVESKDDLLHFFFYCHPVRELWADLEQCLHRLGFDLYFSAQIAVFGSVDFSNALNTLCLYARVYIYRRKLQSADLTYAGFRASFKTFYDLLFSLACKRGKGDLFELQWRPLTPVFSE